MAQKNIATMNNIMPGMAKIQEKYTAARKRGDLYEAAQLGQELQAYTKKHGANPIKNIAPLILQFPIFMSMFFGNSTIVLQVFPCSSKMSPSGTRSARNVQLPGREYVNWWPGMV